MLQKALNENEGPKDHSKRPSVRYSRILSSANITAQQISKSFITN